MFKDTAAGGDGCTTSNYTYNRQIGQLLPPLHLCIKYEDNPKVGSSKPSFV